MTAQGQVAMDVMKWNAVAIAVGDRTGEVRYLGEIGNTPEATRKLVTTLAARYDRLHCCYEAGPTGYGLHTHRRWPSGIRTGTLGAPLDRFLAAEPGQPTIV